MNISTQFINCRCEHKNETIKFIQWSVLTFYCISCTQKKKNNQKKNNHAQLSPQIRYNLFTAHAFESRYSNRYLIQLCRVRKKTLPCAHPRLRMRICAAEKLHIFSTCSPIYRPAWFRKRRIAFSSFFTCCPNPIMDYPGMTGSWRHPTFV